MTSPQGNPARREPLLWLQLLGLAALPLEVAAMLLVLAGADPGPLPGLERLFCWALGALGPAVLFWKLPPDLWSLLLLQVPLRGRRPDQLRLSALQTALPLKLLGAAGAPLLLPLLWWTDRAAGLAWSVSPFTTTPRALVLLLAAVLLAVMLWQWQQILQALWMFTRPAPQIAQTLPLTTTDAAERRLNIGLPLLLLAPLAVAEPLPVPAPAAPVATPPPTSEAAPEPEPETAPEVTLQSEAVTSAEPPVASIPATEESGESVTTSDTASEMAAAETQAVEITEDPASIQPAEASPAETPDEADSAAASPVADISAAIEPEQAPEQTEGTDLDQQV